MRRKIFVEIVVQLTRTRAFQVAKSAKGFIGFSKYTPIFICPIRHVFVFADLLVQFCDSVLVYIEGRFQRITEGVTYFGII